MKSIRLMFLASIVLMAHSLLAAPVVRKGTKIPVRFHQIVTSTSAQEGDTIDAELARDLGGGETRLAAGTLVHVRITRVQRASNDGSVAGMLGVEIESIETGGERYVFVTREVVRRGVPVAGKDRAGAMDRRREAAGKLSDTIGSISRPNPNDIPGSGGGLDVGIEKKSVDAILPVGAPVEFVAITDSKTMQTHPRK